MKPDRSPERTEQSSDHRTEEHVLEARGRRRALECTWAGSCDGCTGSNGTLEMQDQPKSHATTTDLRSKVRHMYIMHDCNIHVHCM